METNLHEWINLLVRWFHVLAAITWIGQTYLFNWMERRLAPPAPGDRPGRDNVAGELWMVHGGGFYLVEKQRVPAVMPRQLHWFTWESALTWLSGVLLLIVVYWTGGVLVAPESGISETAGIAVSAASLVMGWVVYRAIWRSPVGRSDLLGTLVSWLSAVGLLWMLDRWLTPRAAFLHIGAALGTIMAANVWMRILPAQRQLLAAVRAGQPPDLTLAARARRASKHNTYVSVPLVLIMVSNHFPTALYGRSDNWLVLGGLLVVGWGAAKILRDVL